MSIQLSPSGLQKFFDNNGFPLTFGKLGTFAAGTNTPIATYKDAAGTLNTNPITLNIRGECALWIDSTKAYKFTLTDVLGNTIPGWPVDNITIGGNLDNAAVDSGTANNIILSVPTISALSVFTRVVFKAAATNTGATTITVNGTAKNLTWQNLANFAGGEIQKNGIYEAIYDGTQWQLQGPTLQPPQMRTAAEIAAGVTPINYAYAPQTLARYALNTSPGTTDMQSGLQAAIDSASEIDTAVQFSQESGIGKPLLIRSTTVNGIGLIGQNKHNSVIEPLAVDIKQSPQNVNCCIFNQQNNPHLRIEDVRFTTHNGAVAYTGIAIYSQEGGGGDGSGQCIFSAVLRNIFCDFPSTNSGFLTGAIQNTVVDTCTFENMKGVFTIQGVGFSDNYFTNISLFNSYDHFILQTADTNGGFLITVNGLHAYSHNRGRLIDVQNWIGGTISNVVLEPATGNLGDTGLFRFNNCSGVVVDNFVALTRTGVPACAVGIEINGTTSAKFTNGAINANIGLLISGTGTIDVELVNVDLTSCTTASVQINGAASGRLKFKGCKLQDSQQSIFLTSVANSIAVDFEDCVILNAGLGGAAGARNLVLQTNTEVRVVNCRVGQNNGAAIAAYYVDANGIAPGTVKFIDLNVIGTPPTGFNTGTEAVWLDGLEGTWTPAVGGTATYTTQQGRYRVIDNIVYFWGRLTINVIGTGSQTTVTGLPYANNATYYGSGIVPFFASSASNLTSLGLTVAPSASSFVLRTLIAAAAATGTANVLGSGADIIFSGSYSLS